MALREGAGGKEERLHACTIRNSGKPPWIERERETKRGQFKNKVAHMESHENAGERIYAWRRRNAGKDDVLSLSLSPIFSLSLSLLFLMGENKKREIDGGGKRGIKRASLIYVKSCARLAE